MRIVHIALAALLCGTATPAVAQSANAGRSDEGAIVVTGNKEDASIPMSGWRVAETEHLLVYGKESEAELKRIAANLERLHFLLSVQLNRVDASDDVAKLKVTMIGDRAEFNQLKLRNLRWQRGPYPRTFPTELYYDPREDGAVLATTRADQSIILEHGVPLSSLNLPPSGPSNQPPQANPGSTEPVNSLAQMGSGSQQMMAGGLAFPMSAEGRLYAAYAQHYLLTYFPAAYPRWYLDGFGEIFATMNADTPGVIEYGRAPAGFRPVIERYGRFPLSKLLDGRYLTKKSSYPDWTPYHAWALVHLLFFDEELRGPLRNYLGAVAGGSSNEDAAKAFGDIESLQKRLYEYRGRNVPFERLTYPIDRIGEPSVRRLRRSEANFVAGRLELGARMTLPPEPSADEDPKVAARMADDRQDAIRERDAFLRDLRENATRYPNELEVQLLLAEAECRGDNFAACRATADRALALSPKSSTALAWKGLALTHEAVAGPPTERAAKLKAARKVIARANRNDPDAALPLLAYYRSFAASGEPAPDIAVEGLNRVVELVPAAPTPRLMLGSELAARDQKIGARRTLLPIAVGPYDSPERASAKALLAQISAN